MWEWFGYNNRNYIVDIFLNQTSKCYFKLFASNEYESEVNLNCFACLFSFKKTHDNFLFFKFAWCVRFKSAGTKFSCSRFFSLSAVHAPGMFTTLWFSTQALSAAIKCNVCVGRIVILWQRRQYFAFVCKYICSYNYVLVAIATKMRLFSSIFFFVVRRVFATLLSD